ncbi:MAG: hypothetical protein ABI400_02705 [Lacisediminihabitans sp.]
MDSYNPDFFSMMAGFGIVVAIVWFVVTVLLILLAIWIQYTIMWKAVRRGMREFHYGGKGTQPPL